MLRVVVAKTAFVFWKEQKTHIHVQSEWVPIVLREYYVMLVPTNWKQRLQSKTEFSSTS